MSTNALRRGNHEEATLAPQKHLDLVAAWQSFMETVMRVVAAATLCAMLLTGGCTTPDGQFDAGPTLALAAGAAALGGVAYLATRDHHRDGHHRDHGSNRRGWDDGDRTSRYRGGY